MATEFIFQSGGSLEIKVSETGEIDDENNKLLKAVVKVKNSTDPSDFPPPDQPSDTDEEP